MLLFILMILGVKRLGSCTFSVINQKKKSKKKGYTNSGTVTIEWLRVQEEKSFLDYIQSGVQLHFTVAVDFTASNGSIEI